MPCERQAICAARRGVHFRTFDQGNERLAAYLANWIVQENEQTEAALTPIRVDAEIIAKEEQGQAADVIAR